MPRILLISTGSASLPSGRDSFSPVGPPLGLLSLAAALREGSAGDDVAVEVRDLAVNPRSVDEVRDLVRDADPSIVGLSGMSVDEERLVACARAARAEAPGAALIAGGPLATLTPEKCLASGAVDWAVLGEGDRTVVELARAIASGTDPRRVPGVAWMGEDGLPERSRPRSPVRSLDDLPMPSYDLVDLDLYSSRPGLNDLPPLAQPAAPILTSRGCKKRCALCWNSFGHKLRLASPGRVLSDIRRLVHDMGVREIQVVDDMFNADPARMEAILDGIAGIGVQVMLSFPSGLLGGTLSKEQILKLRKAGCYSINFPLITASRRLQRSLGIDIDVPAMLESARHAADAGMITMGSVVLGLPSETGEDMEATIAAIEASAIDVPRVFRSSAIEAHGSFDQAVKDGFSSGRGERDGRGRRGDPSPADRGKGTIPPEHVREMVSSSIARVFGRPERIARLERIPRVYGDMSHPVFGVGKWSILKERIYGPSLERRANRVALVIFNTISQKGHFWGNMQISLLGGQLRDAGVTSTIFVGLMRPGSEEHNTKVIDDLLGEIVEWGPDAVVFHALWLPWLPETLHKRGIRHVLCLDPAQQHDMPEALRTMDPQAGVLAALLGASTQLEAGALLMREMKPDRFSPMFDYRFVGADREIEQTLAFVSMQACPYQVPIRDNPLFEDLDLPDDVSLNGCSYCNGARHYRRMDETEKRRLLEHQVPYLVENLPALEEIAIPFPEDYLDAIVSLVRNSRASGLRPVTFSGQFRHQVLFECETSLAGLLHACEGTGFELHINVVGLESLHDADLMLYNRGTADGVREAIAVVRRLRSAFDPRRFMPGTVGSFILFHPWQDLAGLQVSLRRMREEGVASLFTTLNVNDLRFHPGVPLYHLAKRDGLVVQVQDGSVQDVPLSGYFTEYPWRFRDQAVAGLHRVWKSLEMRIPDRMGLLSACLSAAESTRGSFGCTGSPMPADDLEAFAARMNVACLPRNGMHRALGVGSKSDTRPIRSLADGRTFTDDPQAVARELEELGSLENTRVSIWGPEPTMCESLPEMVNVVRARRPAEVEILTYGRRLAYPWYASSLAGSGVDAVTFLLHSHEAKAHDAFVRVDGAFDQAVLGMRNVASLHKAGGRPQLRLAVVVGPENVRAAHRVAEVASAVGATELRMVIPASGLVLADPASLTRCMDAILASAERLGIAAGVDLEMSFRWVPVQA